MLGKEVTFFALLVEPVPNSVSDNLRNSFETIESEA